VVNAPEPPKPPHSRRERPAKPALTRNGIVEAALSIMRNEGLQRVTMRRVAEMLETGHASLYVYVRNTADLHAQILDALLAGVDAPAETSQPWRTELKALLVRYGTVLFANPDIARMAASTTPSGPHYTAIVESVLRLLAEGGITGRAAAWGVDLLLLYPTAVAVEHSPKSPAQKAAERAAQAAAIAVIDPLHHPHITELGDELLSGDSTQRVSWALDVLIDGILHAARHAPTDKEN
jgi:AcrR family transcriptional regulator